MDTTSRETDDQVTEQLTMVTRVGWITKGLLFVIIGFLGLELARRNYGAEDADQGGALALIANATAGQILVLVVGVGLLLFAAWECWSAVADDDRSLLGVAERIGRFGVGIAYALLGVTGVEAGLTAGRAAGSDGGPTSPEGLTDRLFDLPGGRLVTVVIGIGTIVVGGYQLWSGWRDDFVDDIESDDLGRTTRRALTALGGAGTMARASMLAIVGALFILAAWQYDPSEAAGLDQSLRTMTEGPFGRVLIAMASVGLAAGGVFDIATFHRRRLD